jgi:hypothetical protein
MSNAFYVYCIAGSSAVAELTATSLPSAIEDDSKLEWVVTGDLAALASEVPTASYSEERLAEHLSDASWTAVRAMRHETIAEYVAKRAPIVPLRFGTIFLSRDGIERMLSEKGRELREILERLRGREEWGVNVFCDQSALMADITSVSPVLRELSERAAHASPGQSYLMQKKIDALKVDEARGALNRIVEQVEQALGEQSVDAKRLRVLKVEATEHGELKAKFAFLVTKSDFDAFRDAAERLAQEHQSAGVRLELTGPWPAYNCTAVVLST